MVSRDQGPTDCCNQACKQGRTCPLRMSLHIENGGACIDTDIPQPTDGGDWTPFDKISEAIFWAGATALVVALVSLGASLTIFFFV